MSTFHLEIREFPRNVNRFNMSGREIGAVLLAWAHERVFELADQKWNPQTAEMTVLEGPEIPVSGLSMGRGWPTALREGQDVTLRVLAEAREAIVDGSAVRLAQEQEVPAAAPVADELALGVELAALLGPDGARLLAAWREIGARASGLSPSESLALAERQLREHDDPRG